MFTSTLSFSWSSLIRNLTREVGERTFLDPYRVADLMLEAWLGTVLLALGPSGRTWRIASTSARGNGVGLVPGPTKPVTPGVWRMTDQESSSRLHRHRR